MDWPTTILLAVLAICGTAITLVFLLDD